MSDLPQEPAVAAKDQPAGYTPASRASLWRTVVSIAWAFFGVRKGSAYQEDIKQLNIFHIIFVGIAACFVLVIALMLLAKWATAQ